MKLDFRQWVGRGRSVIYLTMFIFILSAIGNGWPIPIPGLGILSDRIGEFLCVRWNWRGLTRPASLPMLSLFRQNIADLMLQIVSGEWHGAWTDMCCAGYQIRSYLVWRCIAPRLRDVALSVGPLGFKPLGQESFVIVSISFGLISAILLCRTCLEHVSESIVARQRFLIYMYCITQPVHLKSRQAKLADGFGRVNVGGGVRSIVGA